MKYLITLLLIPVFLYCQYSGYGSYDNYTTRDNGCAKYLPNDANAISNWIFDDVYNSDATLDHSGNSHTLTATAGFDWANQFSGTSPVCTNGTALQLDETNDGFYILEANAANFKMGTGDFTLEIWFMVPNSYAKTCVYIEMGTPYGTGYSLYLQGGWSLRFEVADGGTRVLCSSTSINDGAWHYAVAKRDGDVTSLTIDNGTPVTNTGADLLDLDNPGYDFTIGFRAPGSLYNGTQISNIRVSDKARSASEIAAYWNSVQ